MVYILDEGSVFEAPLEKIWKYMASDEHDHPSMSNINREMLGENVVVISADRQIMGKTVRTKTKMTLFPPFGMVQEHLEGPMAGSKAFQYYIPKGDKTGVTVIGDFKIMGMSDEKAVKDAVMGSLQGTFDEDNTNLKKMQ